MAKAASQWPLPHEEPCEFGWEVRPSVSVSKYADRAEVLDEVSTYFGCGTIRPDPSDSTVKWESRSIHDLVEYVLPHFRKYPLLSGKTVDVQHLDLMCTLIVHGQHLHAEGLAEIVDIARIMNPSGRRRYDPDQILRDLRKKMKA